MNGVMVWETPTSIPQISGGTSHVILVAEDTGRDWTMDGQWANGANIFDTNGPDQCEHSSMRFGATIRAALRCCSAMARSISRRPRFLPTSSSPLCNRTGGDPSALAGN